MKPTITYDDFAKVQIATGKVVEVLPFERARTPTYKLRVDFGDDIGERWTSAQARAEYSVEDMLDRLVVAIINLPPKNVAGFMSEVLVLGVPAEDGSLSLLTPSRGGRLGGDVH